MSLPTRLARLRAALGGRLFDRGRPRCCTEKPTGQAFVTLRNDFTYVGVESQRTVQMDAQVFYYP